MPAISVVVPVYKVEPYLKRCVDSILAQTYTDFQLILVDDGSPDNCGRICDEYANSDSRIHVIHRENGGLSAARNSGIDWVFDGHLTEWITFIDSDDWVSCCYLERLLRIAEQNKVNVSIGGYQSLQDGEFVCDEQEVIIQKYSPEEMWCLNRGNATVAWGKLYKTCLFEMIRYPEGKIHEDEFTTYIILFSQQYVAYSSEKLYRYFLSPNSIMRSGWSAKLMDGIEALEQQMFYFKNNGFKLAVRASEKDHMFTSCFFIEQINKTKDIGDCSKAFNHNLSSFLVRYYKCDLFRYKLFCRMYLFVTKYKVIIRGKLKSRSAIDEI